MGDATSDVSEGKTLSEQAYDSIRRDILHCALFPEEKLQIEAISERYGIGIVPVREALNRLSTEGLVDRKSHRGFYVTSISISDLEELVKTRVWLETLALTQSIENGTETWEEQLLVSFHRFARTQRLLPEDAAYEISEDWEKRHKEFHMLLLDCCGSSWLLGFCSRLMDQAVRYRNLSLNVAPNRLRREGAAAEHKRILDAVLDGDANRACELLEAHYRITLDGLRTVMVPDEGSNQDVPRR